MGIITNNAHVTETLFIPVISLLSDLLQFSICGSLTCHDFESLLDMTLINDLNFLVHDDVTFRFHCIIKINFYFTPSYLANLSILAEISVQV